MAAITLLSMLLFGSLVFDCTALEVCDFHTGDVLNVNANANISLQFVITSSGIVTIREMA